jgi:sec-independent protein translocase protein TatA
MFASLTGWHALIILAIVILLFGATKLPALARSVGQSMKIFKNEVKSDEDEKKSVKSEDSTNDTPSNPKP